MRRCRVLVVSAGFLPAESHGGVPHSTFNLSRELSCLEGVEIKIVTTDRNGPNRLQVQTDRWTKYDGLSVAYCSTWRGSYCYAPKMAAFMAEGVGWADAVISSSTLWDYSGRLAATLSSNQGLPNVVYTRGLVNAWALNHKRFKKRIALAAQGMFILRRAAHIVALTEEERLSIVALGIKTPVAVIPNGAPRLPPFDDEVLHGSINSDLPAGPYLLYIGRISRNKGLEQALAAFRRILQQVPKALFVIAGPVMPEYCKEFSELCSCLDAHNLVVLGPVSGHRKHILFRRACGFILTSGGEGMPMGVLEAMQYGLPVVVTPECNVAGVVEYCAGWVVPIGDIEATACALHSLLDDELERSRRGALARNLAHDRYSWPQIANSTHKLLLMLTNGREG